MEIPQVILTCAKFGNHWSAPLTKQSAETKHYTPSALFPSLRLPHTVRARLCLEDVPHSSSLSRSQPLRTSCPSDTLSLSWDTILRMPGVGFTVSLITLSDSFRGTCHCLKLSSFDKWRRRRAERLAHTPRASRGKAGTGTQAEWLPEAMPLLGNGPASRADIPLPNPIFTKSLRKSRTSSSANEG